jgi:hypothetical protein
MLVFAVGLGAHSIAGLEEDGRLELAAAAPVSRRALLAGRAIALHTQLALLTLVVLVTSWGLSVAFGLDVTFVGIVAASVGLQLLACALRHRRAGCRRGERTSGDRAGGRERARRRCVRHADALSNFVADGELLASQPFAWYLGGDPVARASPGAWWASRGSLHHVRRVGDRPRRVPPPRPRRLSVPSIAFRPSTPSGCPVDRVPSRSESARTTTVRASVRGGSVVVIPVVGVPARLTLARIRLLAGVLLAASVLFLAPDGALAAAGGGGGGGGTNRSRTID